MAKWKRMEITGEWKLSGEYDMTAVEMCMMLDSLRQQVNIDRDLSLH